MNRSENPAKPFWALIRSLAIDNDEEEALAGIHRRRRALALAAWVGLRARASRQFRATLDQAKQEIAAKQYGKARKRLIELAPSRYGDGEVDYQLGICEFYRGHPDRALAAWEAVPPEGPFGPRAALQCAMLAMSSGQLTRAEEILQATLGRRLGTDAPVVLRGLQLLYHLEGRTEDVRRAIIAFLGGIGHARGSAQAAFAAGCGAVAAGDDPQTLEKAAEDDDRVWLARANLAIRTGQFDRAAEWLDACSRRRPDDTAVWRARLELSRATGDLAGAWRALEHLPADDFSADRSAPTPRLARLAHWATPRPSARLSPPWSSSSPEIRPPWIGWRSSPVWTATTRRWPGSGRRKSEMLAAQLRYQALLQGDSIGDPAELARLAETLGRRIEARGWALIRDGRSARPGPSRPALVPREKWRTSNGSHSGQSLAELCADLRRDTPKRPALRALRVSFRRFVDDAESAGLRFVHDNGASPLKRLPETMSGGVGLLDYDGDGWLDVYRRPGRPVPAPRASVMRRPPVPKPRRRNASRMSPSGPDSADFAGGYGHGVAVGDYDNDGHPDLFVTRWRSYALLRNRGDGIVRGRDRPGRAGRRSRLAHIRGLGRPRRRRRPRPVRLPLPGL